MNQWLMSLEMFGPRDWDYLESGSREFCSIWRHVLSRRTDMIGYPGVRDAVVVFLSKSQVIRTNELTCN